MTEPVCKAHMTDDAEAFLSIDCTVGHLAGNPAAKKIMEPLFEKMQEMSQEMGQDMFTFARKMKLRDAMDCGNMPPELAEEWNRKLSKIPNI